MMFFLKKLIILLVISTCITSCYTKNDNIGDKYPQLVGRWRHDISINNNTEYSLISDGTAYVWYNYNFAVNGGMNWEWDVKEDTLILLCGLSSFVSKCNQYHIENISDSMLTLSSDSIEVIWNKY